MKESEMQILFFVFPAVGNDTEETGMKRCGGQIMLRVKKVLDCTVLAARVESLCKDLG